jgi:hypothetical protein
MLRIIALVIVLVSSLMVGGGAFAQDRDMTKDQDKTTLQDQDMIKDQDKLQTRDQDKTTDPDKDMVRDRDRDRLDQPADTGMNQGSGRSTESGNGRR